MPLHKNILYGDCRVTPTLMFRQACADGILVALRYGPSESGSPIQHVLCRGNSLPTVNEPSAQTRRRTTLQRCAGHLTIISTCAEPFCTRLQPLSHCSQHKSLNDRRFKKPRLSRSVGSKNPAFCKTGVKKPRFVKKRGFYHILRTCRASDRITQPS